MPPAAAAQRWAPARLLIVAAAGYGKTAALEAQVGEGATYHQAAGLASALARGAWQDVVAGGRHLLIDEMCRLSGEAQSLLLEAVDALPSEVRVWFAARRPLHDAARRRLRTPVFERGPADLALTASAVAELLREEHGIDDAELAAQVHELTAGWPSLVHFAGDAARRADDLLATLSTPGTAAATWVREHVLAELPQDVARVLELAADLEPLSPDLLELLAAPAGLDGRQAFDSLCRAGLLVAHPRRQRPARPALARVVPVVAAVLTASRGPVSAGSGDRLRLAASWYAANGHPLAAAQALTGAGRTDDAAALVESRAEEILAAGGAAGLVGVLALTRQEAWTARLSVVHADALRMSGDAAAARRAFAPLVGEALSTGRRDPALAWRAAMVHYMLADYTAALAVLDGLSVGHAAGNRDEIEALVCRAHVLAMLGSEQQAADTAAQAVAAAEASGEDRAIAAAHVAAANSSTGARRDAHLALALAAAGRAGDVVQTARVLVNQAHALLAAARYEQAQDVAAEAVRVAERGSPPGIRVTARNNLGEALARLGRYDEAARQFELSIALCRRLGLQRLAFGLCGLADIHRQLGRAEQSRTAYEEAVAMARASGEVQVLVPALAGLARVLLEQPGGAPLARAAADEAVGLAPPELSAVAIAAQGWVAVVTGDRGAARQHAADAIAAARGSRALDALAEALELAAVSAPDPAEREAALHEALGIWEAGGAEPAADRVRVVLGRLPSADGATRSTARDARQRLVRLGVRAVHGWPIHPEHGAASAVDVRVLGGFEVHVGGRPVPVPAWRSRQARTLMKILASRRGRRVTRSEVCELLWPDDEPERTAHRLSVLLSAVRSVLDPDRTWPADYFIAADLTGLALDVTHVSVDVEQLLHDAAQAVRLLRSGDRDRAQQLLVDVVAQYRGDAFEDEPYEEWADGLREETRTAWLRSLRLLADLRAGAGDHQDAIPLLVRLLTGDPYDEHAHATLVTVLVEAGRHGEARRAYDRWVRAMSSIQAPLPDPRVLQRRPAVPRQPAPAQHPRSRLPVLTAR